MTITAEQRKAVAEAGEEPVRVEDPETHTAYMLVREDVYKKMHAVATLDHSDLSLYEYEDYRPYRPLNETP